jgi:LPXTG-site transpeptidase (sortase) family protein
MKQIVGGIFILLSIGLLVYGGFLIYERTRPITIQSNQTIVASNVLFSLQIPSVKIDLPAYSASIVDGTWQTTKLGISHLSTSPLPGEEGNSVLYGHNWPNLLGNLHNIKPGDSMFIQHSGATKRFIVQYVSVVGSEESSVYAPTNDIRITLYTCTGLLDTQRLVVVATSHPSLSSR